MFARTPESGSRAGSFMNSRAGTPQTFTTLHDKRTHKSYRLVGEYEKPWMTDKRLKATKWNNIIVYTCIGIGIAVSAVGIWLQSKQVVNHDYCLILDDQFEGTDIDSSTWSHEIQAGGYGTGSFDWTTSDPSNSYVKNGNLHIVPTLTTLTTPITEDQLLNGYTLNLTSDGTCTSKDVSACAVRSNSSLGVTIPPVRSARLTTKGKKSMRYGKVEVVAKMPRGDWLWPAIWMMPENDVYGQWPRSGEIDIMESRGNNISYYGGRDVVSSALHWGPDSHHDGYWRTNGAKSLQHSDFTKEYHTFGLEWSENYLFMYRDSRLNQVKFVDFKKMNKAAGGGGLWSFGGFEAWVNGDNNTQVNNPWEGRGANAPFDQEFYLILNVAVGSSNGWFPDNRGGKPWFDNYANPATQFWQGKDQWYPSWKDDETRGMQVKSVKMWSEGKCS